MTIGKSLLMVVLGIALIFVGVLTTNPENYGAVDVTTVSGVINIVGVILAFGGSMIFVYAFVRKLKSLT